MQRAKIFLIDDERTIRVTFRLALETDGYEVREAASATEAEGIFAVEKFDLVVLDLRLGEDSGLEVLGAMREAGIRTPTLMITAYGSIRHAVRAMQLGAIDFLEKPIEPVMLRSIVAEIVSRHRQPQIPADADFLREAKRLINLQNFDEASRVVAVALRQDERNSDAHNVQGILHEIAGDYDAAKTSYGRAIRLDGQHFAAQQNMRRLFELFNFGRSDEPHVLDRAN